MNHVQPAIFGLLVLFACGPLPQTSFSYPTPAKYQHCTATQQAISDGAYLTATRKVYDAVTYFETAPDPEWKKFKYWFDSEGSDYYRDIATNTFHSLWDLFHKPVTIVCDADQGYDQAPGPYSKDDLPCDVNGPTNKKKGFAPTAYVVPDSSDFIWYCPDRFFASNLDDFSLFGRPALLIHEQTHRPPIEAGDKRIALAYIEGHALAEDPSTATRTADSYQFFALDALAGVTGGCSVGSHRANGTRSGRGLLALTLIGALLLRRRRSPLHSSHSHERTGGPIWSVLAISLLLSACASHPRTGERGMSRDTCERIRPSATLLCSLSVKRTEIANGDSVELEMTLHNRSAEDLNVVGWDTPFARLHPDTLEITRDGETVPFRGIRGDAFPEVFPAASYVRIPARGFASASGFLTTSVDFSRAGTYVIGADFRIGDVQPAAMKLPVTPSQLHSVRVVCTPAYLTVRAR